MQPFLDDAADLPLERFALIMRGLSKGKPAADIAAQAGVTEQRVLAMAPLARKVPNTRPQRRRR